MPRSLEQSIVNAIRRGASFLLDQQSPDGSLRGFLLMPGASTSWLTAHVAFVTEEVPYLDEFRSKAADFLEHYGPDDGGWGYNRRVGVDVDSTVQALMLLLQQNRSIRPFLYSWILASQHPDGGFPTYAPSGPRGLPEHGWQHPHLDVSILTYEWLRRHNIAPDRRSSLLDWLRAQTADCTVPSYWWSGQQYGLWALARTSLIEDRFSAVITESLNQSFEPPHLPMSLTAAIAVRADTDLIATKLSHLLSLQLDDGSWSCARCLRLTDPAVQSAASDADGPRYSDDRRVFSTAHSIAALQFARS